MDTCWPIFSKVAIMKSLGLALECSMVGGDLTLCKSTRLKMSLAHLIACLVTAGEWSLVIKSARRLAQLITLVLSLARN